MCWRRRFWTRCARGRATPRSTCTAGPGCSPARWPPRSARTAQAPAGEPTGPRGPAAPPPRRNLRDTPWATVHQGDAGQVLTRRELPAARLVVLDPPRTGADRDVIGYLTRPATPGPERIAYVSCDPATLARDIARLRPHGWQLAALRAFDAFPMTHHVELLATLERSTS